MKTSLLLCVAVVLLISVALPSGAAPAPEPEPGKAQAVSGGAGEDVRAASQAISTRRGSWAAGQASADRGAIATAARSSS